MSFAVGVHRTLHLKLSPVILAVESLFSHCLYAKLYGKLLIIFYELHYLLYKKQVKIDDFLK